MAQSHRSFSRFFSALFAAIDGTFGSFNAQLALAVNSLKALPTSANDGTFETEVQNRVTRSGNVNWTDYSPNTFNIVAGGNGATETQGSAVCDAGESQATVTYNGTTGSLQLGIKSACP